MKNGRERVFSSVNGSEKVRALFKASYQKNYTENLSKFETYVKI